MGLAQILRQEGHQEGRQEECINLVMRQLRHKLGIQPAIENALPQLQSFTTETLEGLADVLLDFNEVSDFTAWLDTQHSNKPN